MPRDCRGNRGDVHNHDGAIVGRGGDEPPAGADVGQITYGTEVVLLERSGGWLKVALPDRREGWLADDWLVAAGP